MKIACLGWGSLIWDPRGLVVESSRPWNHDGPKLPVEFLRASSGGRITLVITDENGARAVPVLWARMAATHLEAASESLRIREKISRERASKDIGFCLKGAIFHKAFTQGDVVYDWLEGTDLDAAIWTALAPKFDSEEGRSPEIAEVLNYLANLPRSESSQAEEYVRRTPKQIATIYRERIEEALGWTYDGSVTENRIIPISLGQTEGIRAAMKQNVDDRALGVELADSFKALFEVLFPVERADLDFGLYRLLNARRATLEKFFYEDLPALLKDLVDKESGIAELQNELSAVKEKAETLGVPLEQVPRYKQLQAELEQNTGAQLAQEVCQHLHTFISRHYIDGDFMPVRRYRSDAYLVPYDGSETAFVYANQDQYYTKSDQTFETFRVKLPDGRRVVCTVTFAEERLGNSDDTTKQKRRFKLRDVKVSNAELVLEFGFVPSEKSKQADLNAEAVATIQARISGTPWVAELFRTSEGSRPWISTLIDRFTQSVERDFFVHKALGRFLQEELERYLFSDVFPRASLRDDANIRFASRVERVLRGVANPLISLLAQFEDLQRDLWTKPRLVVGSSYALTFDLVPIGLQSTVLGNVEQRKEWHELYGVSPDLTVSAATHPGLFVDTRYFDVAFFRAIEASFSDATNSVNGLVIVSENTAALRTYARKLRNHIDAIYIDPPYNTGGSAFRYKNGYRHSSWCCLMEDAIRLGRQTLTTEGILAVAIDDTELARLQLVADRVLGESRRLGAQVFVTKRSGRTNDRFLATSHEYALYYANDILAATVAFAPLSDEQMAEYKLEDSVGKFKWRDFLRTGGTSTPRERPHSDYDIYWHPDTKSVLVLADPDPSVMSKKAVKREFARFSESPGSSVISGTPDAYTWSPGGASTALPIDTFVKIQPIDSVGQRRVWRKTRLPFMNHVVSGDIQFTETDGKWKVELKDRIKRGVRPKSVTNSVGDAKEFDAAAHGTKLLKNMFGRSAVFSYPKALGTVRQSLDNMIGEDEEATVFDYFAGSGTTGHAVIENNREGASQKYILVEMAEYVDEVTIPRLKKAAYSSAWADGLPKKTDHIQHVIKVVRLESYEDALENVEIYNEHARDETLSLFDAFRREYVPLKIVRDEVARSSIFLPPSLIAKPVGFEISTLDHDGNRRMLSVDVGETVATWLGFDVVWRRVIDDIDIAVGLIEREVRCAVVWRNVESDSSAKVAKALAAAVTGGQLDRIYVNGDVAEAEFTKVGISAEIHTIEEAIAEIV